MQTRSEFVKKLSQQVLTHAERAIAFLWYYRSTQQYDERTPKELALDMRDEGFPMAKPSRLESDLRKGRFIVRGKRKGTVQIDIRKLNELNTKFGPLLSVKTIQVSDSILPQSWISGTRRYLEQLFNEINGCYEIGFYNSCAAMQRRLMESLLLEIYIKAGRQTDIQNGGVFFTLDKLISHIKSDKNVVLGRNTPKSMEQIKELGDTAAHDRTYLVQKVDVDDMKHKFRKMINELLDITIRKP